MNQLNQVRRITESCTNFYFTIIFLTSPFQKQQETGPSEAVRHGGGRRIKNLHLEREKRKRRGKEREKRRKEREEKRKELGERRAREKDVLGLWV